jgi:hypothetical protein
VSRTVGLTISGSFTVTVVDTTPPVLTVRKGVSAVATSPSGAVVTFTATATDIVDGTDPVTCTPPSGSTFAIGTKTVTCSATDKHGNSASASFPVTVTAGVALIALDASKSAALQLTGSAALQVKGGNVYVDSSASNAAILSGTTKITCNELFLVGGDSVGSSASISGTVVKGAAKMPDPLAGLPAPSPTGLTVQAKSTLVISGSQKAVLNPGIYQGAIQITNSGSATMNPGIYYLQGGLALSGSGTLSGSGFGHERDGQTPVAITMAAPNRVCVRGQLWAACAKRTVPGVEVTFP